MPHRPAAQEMISVWDPLVRLFHWSLVTACLVAYFTQEEEYRLHLYAGYTVLGLLGFRLIWGWIGTKHARFADFVTSPKFTARYLGQLLAGRAPRFIGHNPAGGTMIVLMLLVLLVITLSGIALDGAENRAGPLAATRLFLYTDIIAEIHETATHLGSLMVAVHLLGVVVSSKLHKENLVRAMIDGKKRR